jgi:tetratricopeptide (TPR) repeat protein
MSADELKKMAEEIQTRERGQFIRFSVYSMLMITIGLAIGAWSVYEGFRARQLQLAVQQKEKKIDSLEERIQKAGARLAEMQEKLINNYTINSDVKIGLENFYSGRFDLAIKEYAQAIKLDSSNYVLYDFSGYAYFKIKNYPKATELLMKSVELNSNYTWGHYNLGLVYWMSGDKVKARKTFRTLLSIDKSFAQTMKNDNQFVLILQDREIKDMLK